jgi:dolichol-phosphate mannosyltransferase
MNNAASFLSLIIPAYREAAGLKMAFELIRQHTEPLARWEYILVDDGSTDDTWAVIEGLAGTYDDVVGISLSRNFGKEGAIAAGLAAAKGDAVVVMDADLQHPPQLIAQMVDLWRGGAEVVNTQKRSRGKESSLKRWLVHRYFGFFSWLVGMEIGNAADFKLLDRSVVDCMNQLPERARFFRGLVAWVGFRQETIEFDVAEREFGAGKWSFVRLARLAIDSIMVFSTLPMQLMTVIGSLFGLLAVGLTLQTLWMLWTGQALPGFATVILLLIVIGSVLMIGLGIIGLYLAKIYEEVKSRPGFIVRQVSAGGENTTSLPDAPHNDKARTPRSDAAAPNGPEQPSTGLRLAD